MFEREIMEELIQKLISLNIVMKRVSEQKLLNEQQKLQYTAELKYRIELAKAYCMLGIEIAPDDIDVSTEENL
jgi:hypothetical protein